MKKRKSQKPRRVYAPHSVDDVKDYLGFRVWRSEDRQIHTELLVEWEDSDYSHQWTPTTEQDLPEWTETKIVSQVVFIGKNYADSIRELFISQFPYENKCLEVYIRDDQALISVSRAPVKVKDVYLQLMIEDPAADNIESVPHIRKITEDVEMDEDEWITSTTQTTMAVRQIERTCWRKISSICAGSQMEKINFKPSNTSTVINKIITDTKPSMNDSTKEEIANFEMKLGHVRANEVHEQLNQMQNSNSNEQPENNENESNENNDDPDFSFYKSLFEITVWSDPCSDNCNNCTQTSADLDSFLGFFNHLFPSISIKTIKFMRNHFYKVLTGENVDDDGLFDGFDHLHRYFCPEGANNSAAENRKQIENLYQLYLNCSYCEILIDYLVAIGQLGKHKEVLKTEQPIGLSDKVFEHLSGIVCDAIASKKKSVKDNEFKRLAFQETTAGLTPLSLATVTTEGGLRPETLFIDAPNHDNHFPPNGEGHR